MAHVSQNQRRAHTAIYNLMTRANNRTNGSKAVDNILKMAIDALTKEIHLGDGTNARHQYRLIIAQCFGEDVI